MSCCSLPCNTSSPINNPCKFYPDTKCVVYTGPVLPCIGVTTNERLESILKKIDAKLCAGGGGGDTTITLVGDVTGTGATIINTTVNWPNGYTTYDARYFLTVKEEDGTPNVRPVTTIVLGDNLSMTDDGNDQVTINAADVCCSLQGTCNIGFTTTTSIIIGSSNTAHSGTTGQLIQGANSTASTTNGVALNNSTNTGINATSLNSSTVSGQNALAAGNCNVSGNYSVAIGNNNTLSCLQSLSAGRDNTSITGSSSYCESNIFLGVANSNSAFARGSVALGGANTVGCDFSVAVGTQHTTLAKGSVALGIFAKTTTYGETAFASGSPNYSGKVTNAVGMCQTSIITMINHDVNVGNNHTLSTKGCTDTNGNEQSCTGNDVNPYGLYYYQVDDNTVYYVQGRLIGITATGDVCVWTIDSYFKNVAGVITSGTSSFTNIIKDAAFTNMNSASLSFVTVTGNIKSLRVAYTNTATYPVAEYSCTLTINKLTWKA